MDTTIRKPNLETEFETPEGCAILEAWNEVADDAVSIARARVRPGVTTQLHLLHGVVERYLIISGSGVVSVGALAPSRVGPGDVVVIPAGVVQKIFNDGGADLVFYCICTPRFTPGCYQVLA